MGTPFSYGQGFSNDSGAGSADSPAPGGAASGESVGPSRSKVLHEMRRAFGLLEYFDAPSRGDSRKNNAKKSPGLGLRTESAWSIWQKAIDFIDQDPTMPKQMVILRAMAKAGVNRGQLDSTEYRLLEMGIESYLARAVAEYASARNDKDK